MKFPFDNQPILVVVSTLAFGVGGFILGRAQQPMSVAIQQPLDVRVSGTVAANAGPGNQVAADLLAQVMDTIVKAKNAGIDTAKIPVMVATEIAKGASSEVGKKFIDLVTYLATLPFKSSGNPQQDGERIMMLIRERIYMPAPVGPVTPLSPILTTAQVTFDPNDGKHWSPPEVLEAIRATAVENSESVVLLFANTDTTGSEKRNTELARERATTIRNVLTKPGGLAPNRVFVAELAVIALPRMTGTDVADVRNRSVTIQVRR